eukprot:Hpha_TRINITY_DN17662_c0_g1::TRINITY_DN17662_c0_g1_i1::g.158811::m.158811
MVMGGVACSLYCFERIASRWKVGVLADGATYALACRRATGLLLGAVFFPKRGTGALRLYSMTSVKPSSPPQSETGVEQSIQEWIAEPEQPESNEFMAHAITSALADCTGRAYLWDPSLEVP